MAALNLANHCFANRHEDRLFQDLFATHNKLALPNRNPTDPVILFLMFQLRQILDVVSFTIFAFALCPF